MRIETNVKWLADGYKHKLFADYSIKDQAISPSDKDNFNLLPEDDPKSFVEYDIGGQTDKVIHKPKHGQRRIKSASSVRLQDRPWRHPVPPKYPQGFIPRSRPSSALPPKTRSSSAMPTPRRIKSAGSVRTLAESRAQETIDELRKGFTLVNKLYENDYRSGNISLHPASPAPDFRYFDRHSRCYNHTHAHRQPYSDRPQRACEKYLESCGSRAISPARPDDPNVQPQRYIDYHRPRTAPGTRKELQYVPRPSYVYRNHTPHFCNFVHQISLHERESSGHVSQELRDMEYDDGDDVEFIMESAEGRLISKYRKTSNASSRGGLTHSPKLEDYEVDTVNDSDDIENWLAGKRNNRGLFRNNISSIPEIKEDTMPSGTEGRPGSPSSLDGDSRLEEENQQPVTGIEVRLSSPIKSDRSEDRRSKAEDLLSSRSGMSIPEEKEERGDADKHKGAFDNKFKPLTGGESVAVPSSSDSDNNNRAESPRQPPPSPEPQKQTIDKPEIPLTTTQPTPKKRGCVTKKTKKPIERTRKMKPIEEPKEAEPVKVEEVPVVDMPTVESDKVDSKIDLKVPDLPTNIEKEKTRKEKTKPKKHLIEHEDDLYRPDPTELLNEQLKQNRTEFDWSNMEQNGIEDIKRAPQIKSWISGRLALSQQASRFELPMDMKKLEKMTPQEYVRKHCIITSRRQNLYQKIFLKNKDKSQVIVYKDLDKSLKDVLVNTITSEQVQDVLNMLNITESTKVDYQLFAGMAAFAERVLYPSFVTDDTREMPEYQREKIECADFSALPWKLHGVKVNEDMRKMLEQIS